LESVSQAADSRSRDTVNSGQVLHGEQVAVELLTRVGRLNRSKVKVRVLGNSSFARVELACNWGADVADNAQVTSLLSARLQVPTTTPALAIKLPPDGPWHGLLFATVRTLQLVQHVFDAWLPGDAVLAVHGKLSRRELANVVPAHSNRYHYKVSRGSHSGFGGSTVSGVSFTYLVSLLQSTSMP
jgi:hypothetical protein